jgi:3',5'-nucleoside bisphosphate phosphatase
VRVDLHCHSTCSDGADPPALVAERASRRGVSCFALSDHDTCAGYDAVRAVRADALRAVELSCRERGRTVHVLVYGSAGEARDGGGWAALEAALAELRAARRRRLRLMAERLVRRNLAIDAEAILEAAGDRPVGRPDLARALVSAGAATSVKEAFARFLRDDLSIDEAGWGISIGEGLELCRAAGARASLAHPHQHGRAAFELVRRYKAAGLGGLEALYGSYDAGERARWLELADGEGLVATAGSDYHGPRGNVSLGVDIDDERARALCDWLGVRRPAQADNSA